MGHPANFSRRNQDRFVRVRLGNVNAGDARK